MILSQYSSEPNDGSPETMSWDSAPVLFSLCPCPELGISSGESILMYQTLLTNDLQGYPQNKKHVKNL